MAHVISTTTSVGITLSNQSYNPVTVAAGSTILTTAIVNGALYGKGGSGNSWTISNYGYISGASAAGGVYLGSRLSTVTNSIIINETGGQIAGNRFALFFHGSGSITNQKGATISAVGNNAAYLLGNSTVINYGIITGIQKYGVETSGGSVVNHSGGTISGNSVGILLDKVSTVTNAGVVHGEYAVQFYTNSPSDRLIVDPGASFIGRITGGTGVLELAGGSGGNASLNTLSTTGVTNFGTLRFDPGSKWTVSGNTDNALIQTVAITGFTVNETINLTGFAAVSETFSNNALVLEDASNVLVTLNIQGSFSTSDFHISTDGTAGTDVTEGTLPATFTWTNTGTADWNTPSAWDLGAVPGSINSAVISNPGSNTVAIASGENVAIYSVTVGGTDTLSVTGILSAQTVTDDAMLAFVGSHALIGTPLTLGGTLWMRNAGTLTLGASEVITQAGVLAEIGSSTAGGETIVNQGTISALGNEGGSLAIVPLSFINHGTINVTNEAITIGYDSGGVHGAWSNDGLIAMSETASLTLDGSVATAGIGNITGAIGVTEAGILNNAGNTLNTGSGTELGTINLVNGAVVTGGTVVDNGNGFTFDGGTFNALTYQGALTIASSNGRLNVTNGLTATGFSSNGPGTIALTEGGDAQLDFIGSQTIDNATISLDGTDSINPLTEIDIGGGSGPVLTLGRNLTVSSTAAGTRAAIRNATSLDVTSVVNRGTIIAAAANGSFAISPNNGFTNFGTVLVSNADTLSIGVGISGNAGTIAMQTGGVTDVTSSVAAGQTIAFRDATGLLRLHQPGSVAATITGFVPGDTIDLAAITATTATWSANRLTISNSGTTVATLSLTDAGYVAAIFTVSSDNAGGSQVTVTGTCFGAGTGISTPHGEVAVEHLRTGDLVFTVSGQKQPVRWIGHRRVDFRHHPNRRRVLPVRVAAHTFGRGQPKRDLLLSPDHAVFVDGVLIPVRHLTNGNTISQIECEAITYYHVELPRHDVVLANGLPAETYLDAGARHAFANDTNVARLHPDFAPPGQDYALLWETMGCAPLIVEGELLGRVRARLRRPEIQSVAWELTQSRRNAA